MSEVGYTWHDGGAPSARLARVERTRGTPYRFGETLARFFKVKAAVFLDGR
jgi:hypothetical protein